MYVLALLTLASVMTYGSEVNNHDISNLYERHRGVINTIPFVGMGTAGLGENTESIACLGLQAGFRLLDTAEAVEWYNETALGHALRECETLQALAHETNVTTRKFDYDEVIIVTKVHPRSFGVKRMREALSASSALIYTQQPQRPLDIVLLHSPFCWPGHCSAEEEKVPWQTAWRNLEVLQKEDRVRSIGVSNFDASLLTELLKMSNRKVAVVQNWMDPFHQDQEVRHIAREHGIVYMAYSSFGTQWHGRFGDRNPVLGNEVLQEMAARYNSTVAAVILGWLRAEGVVAIPRASNPYHLAANAKALKSPLLLSEADLQLVQALDHILDQSGDSP